MNRSVIIAAMLAVVMLGACSGGGGGDNGDNGNTPLPHYAFVTAASGSGNMSAWIDANGQTGLAAADNVCNARAAAAGLPGTYVAWLSDANDDAYCRVHGLTGKKGACVPSNPTTPAGPWMRTDGTPFGADIDEMLDNDVVYTPARFDETGSEVSAWYYWTGTLKDGTAGNTCLDWTDNTVVNNATKGFTTMTFYGWTELATYTCDRYLRLLCMEAGPGPALSSGFTTGKRVFMTSTTTNPAMGGLAGGDSFCQDSADNAGLGGTYKAWLSDSATNAIDRLAGNGPWVRLDGIKVADNKADLIDGNIFAPINLDENSAYHIDTIVWTGTLMDGTVSMATSTIANTCSDWTAASGLAMFGYSGRSNNDWTDVNLATCGSSHPVYCFED